MSLCRDPIFMIPSSEINLPSRLHSGRNLLSSIKNVASHTGSCVGGAVYKMHWQNATVNWGPTGILCFYQMERRETTDDDQTRQ